MPDTVRSFIAIELPKTIVSHIQKVRDALKSSGLEMSWVRPENIHLTLKFLGNVKKTDIEKIGSEMVAVADGCRPFSLAAKGLGVFPGIKRPRVVWLGLKGDTPALIDLQKMLEDRLDGIGFPKENKAFRAHLTLARIKRRIDTKRLLDSMNEIGHFESSAFTADRIVLFKSDLKPSGAVYTKLSEVNFNVRANIANDPT